MQLLQAGQNCSVAASTAITVLEVRISGQFLTLPASSFKKPPF